MNQPANLLVTSGLSLFLFAFLLVELSSSGSRLEYGLARAIEGQRTSAQSSRLRKNSLSLWEGAGVRDEVSESWRRIIRSSFISCYAKPHTLTLSQRERGIVSPFEGQRTSARAKQ